MQNNNKIIQACVLLGSLCLSQLAVAMPNLILGSAKVSPSNRVEVPLTFTNNGLVSAVQLDIQYDASQLTSEVPVLDGTLNTGFRVLSHESTAGKMKILVIPPINNPVINSGIVIRLPFTLNSDATILTAVPVHITLTVLSDANAGSIDPVKIVDSIIIHSNNLTSDSDSDGIPDYYEIDNNLLAMDASDASSDADGDNLSNLIEYQIGTQVNNADTDGDMIADGYEYFYALNPTVFNDSSSDFDGDGVSDVNEFLNGTDASGASEQQIENLAAKPGFKKIGLSWDSTSGNTVVYNIYWGNSPGVTKFNGYILPGVNNPYEHSGLISSTEYYYVVTALNDFGESPESAEIKATPDDFSWYPPILNLMLY